MHNDVSLKVFEFYWHTTSWPRSWHIYSHHKLYDGLLVSKNLEWSEMLQVMKK